LLLRSDRNVKLSISVTTRSRRRGEINGRDYHFIDRARFDEMVRGGELLEWAEVFGHHYGTPRDPVLKALQAGRDVLFDIDWQGTEQLSKKDDKRTDLVSVFILPPTAKDLEHRLKRRAQDSKAVIGSRMAKASDEMSHWHEYDYIVVNRDKRQALTELRAILAAERLKRERQVGLSDFVRRLQAKL
jgi:guanylate kinase